MSQYPRRVLAGVTIAWDGNPVFIKAGTILDCVPGSQLEAAYGGPSNLSAVIPPSDPSRSPEDAACFTKEALGNYKVAGRRRGAHDGSLTPTAATPVPLTWRPACAPALSSLAG